MKIKNNKFLKDACLTNFIKEYVMRNRLSKNYFAMFIALFMAIAITGGDLFAQSVDFINNGGTYLANDNTGRIVMKGQGGGADNGYFSGTDPLGVDAASRIQGTVEWRRDGNQIVQGRYYTHLALQGIDGTGDDKDIEDAVYVFGFYQILGNCGDRDYDPSGAGNIFHYNNDGATTYTWTLNDGTSTTTDQVIYGENGTSGTTNRYNNLDIYGGPKRTEDEVNCAGYLTNSQDDNTATLLLTNNFYIGEGDSDIDAEVNVDRASNTVPGGVADPIVFRTTGTGNMAQATGQNFNVAANGMLDLRSTGVFTVNGILDLADNGGTADGALNVGYVDGTVANDVIAQLNIVGEFLNNVAAGSRTNMTFATGSFVRYQQDGAGEPRVASTNNDNAYNKYANLELSGTSTKYVDGPVYMRGNLVVNDANFEIGPSGGPSDDLSTTDFLDMDLSASPTPTVSYDLADNTRYVLGKMRVSGTIPTDTPIRFNNHLTTIDFATAPLNGTLDQYFQLDVFPGDESDYTQIKCSKDATWREENLTRHIRMKFTSDAANVQINTMVAGYVGATDKDGFTADEENMRFYEGYDGAEEQQKIIMRGYPVADATINGDHITLSNSGNAVYVEPIALAGGGTTGEISDESDIILGASPILYITERDGRWSHATTWDEGVVPTWENDCEIRHLCYTGIDGPAFNVDNHPDDEIDGSVDATDAQGAARSITIRHPSDDPDWYHPALVIGQDDANYAANTPRLFRTILTTDATDLEMGSIINLNDGSTGPANMWAPGDGLDKTYDANGTTDTYNRIQGIYVLSPRGLGSGNEYWPMLGAGKIVNSGRVVNEGIIEVGR